MRKLTLIATALLMGLMMLVSCNKEKDNNDGKTVFYANIESGNQGRTHLDPDFLSDSAYVLWSAGDQIKIYNVNGDSQVFTLQSGANTTNAVFVFDGEFELAPPYVAVYPYGLIWAKAMSTTMCLLNKTLPNLVLSPKTRIPWWPIAMMRTYNSRTSAVAWVSNCIATVPMCPVSPSKILGID